MGQRNIYERYGWFDNQVKRGRYPNASSLARQFEVSTKTAQRDIEFMRDRMSAPLLYDTSEKGYYYEDETFSLPISYLSSDELSSLILAKRLLEGIGSEHVKNEIDSVIDKIGGILVQSVSKAELVDETVSVHLFGHSPAPEDVFNDVLRACLTRMKLAFRYYSPLTDQETERVVRPYHTFNYMGTWHLIAHCEERGCLRDFVLARMSALQVLDTEFIPDKSFSITEYLGSTFGIYKGKPTTEVVLRFNDVSSRWVRSQVWHKDQVLTRKKDGTLELTLPVSNLEEIKMEVLKFGSQVKVIKPKKLREMIEAEARGITKKYEK